MVEHPLGKGEVVSSILTGSTKNVAQNQHLNDRTLPSPPRLDREQDANPPRKLGEIWGKMFDGCSRTVDAQERAQVAQVSRSALAVSPELAASVARMLACSSSSEAKARAYERGVAPTRPAGRPSWASDAKLPPHFAVQPVWASNAKLPSRFRASRIAPRPCRRRLSSEERITRRHRKRVLGGSSALPDTLRWHYTEGERAALCIVAFEVKRHGRCDLSIDEIADRAGIGRTTVQNAMHEARRLGHVEITERPQRGAKNLPNLVKITSRDWLAWVKRGAQWDRVQKFKNVSTSKSWENKQAGPEIAEGSNGLSGACTGARTGPPNQAPSSETPRQMRPVDR